MAGLNENKSEFQVTVERPLGEVRKGFTHFAEGDVLFAKITPCMENGKGGIARNLKNGLGCGTTEVHVIRSSNKNSCRLHLSLSCPTFNKLLPRKFLQGPPDKRAFQRAL